MTHQPRGDDREIMPADSLGDARAAEEAWAAWRQLLDDAQLEFDAAIGDEGALAEGLLRRMARRRKRARKRVLAAAAAVLACCGAGWFAAGSASQNAAAPEPRRVAAAYVDGPDGTDWEDEGLDWELAMAQRQAAVIESQWRRQPDSLAFVRRQMDALEAEFEGDSL